MLVSTSKFNCVYFKTKILDLAKKKMKNADLELILVD